MSIKKIICIRVLSKLNKFLAELIKVYIDISNCFNYVMQILLFFLYIVYTNKLKSNILCIYNFYRLYYKFSDKVDKVINIEKKTHAILQTPIFYFTYKMFLKSAKLTKVL